IIRCPGAFSQANLPPRSAPRGPGNAGGGCYADGMATTDLTDPATLTPAPITSSQPGGGFCMRLELACGRLPRAFLRAFRAGYVRGMAAKRQGQCENCPHDVIDSRDLKFYRNVCGYWFREEDDRFRWRGRLRLARAGLAEVLVFSAVLGTLLVAFVLL